MSHKPSIEGYTASPEEAAVLEDLARAMAGIHIDRKRKNPNEPTMAMMAGGLIGMLAAHQWKEQDHDVYVTLVGLAALLYLNSGAATISEFPINQKLH